MGMEKIVKIEPLAKNKTRPRVCVWDIQTSGGGTFVYNGIIIHNSAVEQGREAEPIEGTQRIHVSSYTRKTKTGRTRVKAHDKVYENKRLIRFRPRLSKMEFGDPIFRVVNKQPAIKPHRYLERAYEEKIGNLAPNIKSVLKRRNIGEVK